MTYYQQRPGWGTSQFQFGAPTAPSFQPQPSWQGVDYYRAHAHSPDLSLYDHAWSRVRDHTGVPAGGTGVGMHEARHWHRRAYGGLGELSRLLPNEIGHAAAYEAYRKWIHNSSIYEPLSGDVERQREGLIGLAVAEASHLLQYASRGMDTITRLNVSESAAYTASIIFYQSREPADDDYHSRSRRHGSYSYDDPYAYDNALAYPGHRTRSRSRSRPRSRSHSRYRSNSNAMPLQIGYGSPAMPGVAQSGYQGQPGSYGSYSGSNGIPMPMQGSSYGGSPMQHMPMGTSPPYQGSPYQSSSYQGASYQPGSSVPMVVPMGRSRSSSMSSYSQNPYMGAAMSNGGMIPPPTQTIVITSKPHRKHRHHHHKRSRSNEPGYGYSSSRY